MFKKRGRIFNKKKKREIFSFFHRMLVLLVLFLSFLLNIYMRIHNYTDTTPFYNIFIIIEVSIF